MPLCLDVYSWSAERNRATIDAFLAEYVDLAASKESFGDQLTALPVGFDGHEDDLPLESWDWIPVGSLAEAVDVGLSRPPRAFRLYLRAQPRWCGAQLAFTATNEIVFGVSVDDSSGEPSAALTKAERTMTSLLRSTGGIRGWVVAEEPPPLRPDLNRPWTTALASAEP